MPSRTRGHRLRSFESTHPIVIVGQERVHLQQVLDDAHDLEVVERTVEFDCTSGRRISGVWEGIPIIPLVERVGIPGRSTHLVIRARDDQTGCVSMQKAIDGLLAFKRDGNQLAAPRFVAANVSGARTIKDVTRIEAVELVPGEDRAVYENLTLASEAP